MDTILHPGPSKMVNRNAFLKLKHGGDASVRLPSLEPDPFRLKALWRQELSHSAYSHTLGFREDSNHVWAAVPELCMQEGIIEH